MVGATWVLPADTPFGSCFLGDQSAVGAMDARADAPRVGVTGLSVVLVLDADLAVAEGELLQRWQRPTAGLASELSDTCSPGS